MILATAIVLLAAVVIAWATRLVDRTRPRRFARWTLFVLGVLAALLIVVEVGVVRPAVPVVLVATVLSLALVLITLWTVSGIPHSPAERWADAHGVRLVDANRDFVQRYVSEGHRLRLVCGLGGAIAISALGRGLGVSVPVSGWVTLMIGYLGGVVWSEAWLTRLPTGTRRSASLAPRRVRSYLAPRLRVAQIVVPTLAIIVGIVALAVPATPPADPVDPAPEFTVRATAFLVGLIAGLVMLGVAWLQRHIVTKPQPDADPDLLAADDAVRASSVHLLSGTGLGIVLAGLTSQVWLLGDLGIIGTGTAGGVGLGCSLAALIAWRYYCHRAWVVRRSGRPDPVGTRLSGVSS